MERDSNEAYIFEKGYPGGSKMRLGKILHVWTLVILARKLAFESEILADFFNFSQKKFGQKLAEKKICYAKWVWGTNFIIQNFSFIIEKISSVQ